MPRKVQPDLVGGRALYTGKNAYASQTFENDTRQRQLPGLAACYLSADRTNTAQDALALVWGQSISSIGTPNVFLRGFWLLADGATLQCTTPGSYKLSCGLRFAVLAASTTGVFRVQVKRAGNVVYDIVSTAFNTGAVNGQFQLTPPPVPVDLQIGDQVYMVVQSPGAGLATLGSAYSTGLYLEAIDTNL